MFKSCMPLLLVVPIAHCAAQSGSLLGADLRYVNLDGLAYSFTVITYVDPNGPADAPELLVSGDGGIDTVPRTSQMVTFGSCYEKIEQDTYTWQVTFSGPGVHTINAWKSSRSNATNLSPVPDGVLCLSTSIIVTPGLMNASPVFGTPQRTGYYAGNTYTHDPMVTDPDGDSLSFQVHTPTGTDCQIMTSYTSASSSTPEGDSTVLNPTTGVLQWFNPNLGGIFAIGITCNEWRDGVNIGSVTRDMTLCVQAPFTGTGESDHPTTLAITAFDGAISIKGLNGTPTVGIYDASGSLVLWERATGASLTILDRSLAPGIYQVMVYGENGTKRAGRFTIVR